MKEHRCGRQARRPGCPQHRMGGERAHTHTHTVGKEAPPSSARASDVQHHQVLRRRSGVGWRAKSSSACPLTAWSYPATGYIAACIHPPAGISAVRRGLHCSRRYGQYQSESCVRSHSSIVHVIRRQPATKSWNAEWIDLATSEHTVHRSFCCEGHWSYKRWRDLCC